MGPQIELYDTTLRDGAQAEGISYSVQDKLRIAQRLDALGVDYVEGGWPGSNPKDAEFFTRARRLKFRHAVLTAFGSTRRPATPAGRDANLKALVAAQTRVVTIFGKSWDLHVRVVFGVPLDENLRMIEDSVAFLRKAGRRVIYDAEHFFDGYRHNPEYALKTLEAALSGGAEALVLCDTNGGTVPTQVRELVGRVRQLVGPRVVMGLHAHNDSELAVANSLAAVEAGCAHIQGTINGYGERCGNANLVSIIANLQLKLGHAALDGRLKELTEVSRFVAEVSNMAHQPHQPFVGSSAFAHKGGVHVNAVMKDPRTYEHLDPALVGNERKILVSELSGRSSLVLKAQTMQLHLTKNTPQTKALLAKLQELEHQGYHFEAAEGSLQLLMQRHLKQTGTFFDLEGFRIIVENRKGKLVSEATIKVRVRGVEELAAAEGDGPVNALDNAIRRALVPFYPSVASMHLTDFKVRVLDEKAGTAAKVRVLIQSQDEHDTWGTIGVSENIIEASWHALVDSIDYKLMNDKRHGRLVTSARAPAAKRPARRAKA